MIWPVFEPKELKNDVDDVWSFNICRILAVVHPHEDSDADSDLGSEATHLSLDDDLDSVVGDG